MDIGTRQNRGESINDAEAKAPIAGPLSDVGAEVNWVAFGGRVTRAIRRRVSATVRASLVDAEAGRGAPVGVDTCDTG
ncbi:hypothetical protein [Leekyejoonella antrihumi]|uniref:Uncharacterized protein n=1 Tax=Leekyejoonella antrihumi TaxID=1660198 RepID=A0A563E3S2_9MICO|nr:hypothetical protein [Leekyejoonella antrihumi]TWP37167.1 hypothetical protein FGL98_07060 [Leekyejoonella antrihumi]